MENQIDEMAKAIQINCHKGLTEDEAKMIAKWCYQEIDRKSADVAREIFDEFHNMLLKFVSDFDDGLEKANDKATAVVLDCARETILLVILSLGGLKKKYICEETNVTTNTEDGE